MGISLIIFMNISPTPANIGKIYPHFNSKATHHAHWLNQVYYGFLRSQIYCNLSILISPYHHPIIHNMGTFT